MQGRKDNPMRQTQRLLLWDCCLVMVKVVVECEEVVVVADLHEEEVVAVGVYEEAVAGLSD